tara:strand:+ start:692 stop:967 length:276 start_codon:yes stop_codon:yes gene_type:complete
MNHEEETFTSKHWVLVHPKTGDRHSFHRSRGDVCQGTVVVDSGRYGLIQGRRFWNEYIRIGFIVDEKAYNECKVWNMKEFYNVCREREQNE